MSTFLNEIIENKNQTASVKVVFVDIVSYSKRRSQAQASVINSFIACMKSALKQTAQAYISYSDGNDVSLTKDIVVIPTGDGAAVCFPFEGLSEVHLTFAQFLMAEVRKQAPNGECSKFDENDWCNCHPYFALTLGVSEGKCILYRDVNNSINIAGNAVNMAARVMGKADANQMMFTEEAYRQLIDLVDDPHMDEKFVCHSGVPIKHGEKINVYQYVDAESDFDPNPPEDLVILRQSQTLNRKMAEIGMPTMPDISNVDRKSFGDAMEKMIDSIGALGGVTNPTIEGKPLKK